jgi:hypothetical protein
MCERSFPKQEGRSEQDRPSLVCGQLGSHVRAGYCPVK